MYNITKLQKAVFKEHKSSKIDNNPYEALRQYHWKYYSIINYGIKKISKELNGVFLRTIDQYSEGSSYTITNNSWALIGLKGGSLNAKNGFLISSK